MCPVEYQKFIAYAVIGYLDVIKRTGSGDLDINRIFPPPGFLGLLREYSVDESIVEAIYQLDEMEALRSLREQGDFDLAVRELISPIISYLRNNSAAQHDGLSAVAVLLNFEEN